VLVLVPPSVLHWISGEHNEISLKLLVLSLRCISRNKLAIWTLSILVFESGTAEQISTEICFQRYNLSTEFSTGPYRFSDTCTFYNAAFELRIFCQKHAEGITLHET
jgi:hypothetical protein